MASECLGSCDSLRFWEASGSLPDGLNGRDHARSGSSHHFPQKERRAWQLLLPDGETRLIHCNNRAVISAPLCGLSRPPVRGAENSGEAVPGRGGSCPSPGNTHQQKTRLFIGPLFIARGPFSPPVSTLLRFWWHSTDITRNPHREEIQGIRCPHYSEAVLGKQMALLISRASEGRPQAGARAGWHWPPPALPRAGLRSGICLLAGENKCVLAFSLVTSGYLLESSGRVLFRCEHRTNDGMRR